MSSRVGWGSCSLWNPPPGTTAEGSKSLEKKITLARKASASNLSLLLTCHQPKEVPWLCLSSSGQERTVLLCARGKQGLKCLWTLHAYRRGEDTQLSPVSSSYHPIMCIKASRESYASFTTKGCQHFPSWTEISILQTAKSLIKATTTLTPLTFSPWAHFSFLKSLRLVDLRPYQVLLTFLKRNKWKLVRTARTVLDHCRVTNCHLSELGWCFFDNCCTADFNSIQSPLWAQFCSPVEVFTQIFHIFSIVSPELNLFLMYHLSNRSLPSCWCLIVRQHVNLTTEEHSASSSLIF